MQRAVRRLDPNLPLGEIATMEQRISRSITTPRFYTALLMTFAIIAFALAAGGIYSSMLYTVGQRQREVGIRLALGAQAGDVAWMVVRHGTLLTGIGIAIGLAAALLFSRILESFVFGITTTDTATFAAVSFALAIVALTACYFPARRAAATDPIQTLRME
jgi:ABC-type antimicrobial peptide transport system permease subunit